MFVLFTTQFLEREDDFPDIVSSGSLFVVLSALPTHPNSKIVYLLFWDGRNRCC